MSTEKQYVDPSELTSIAGPYPIDAFDFVREGLTYTTTRIHGAHDGGSDLDRHVSGQQLCLGLRDFAIDRFGLMAPLVLSSWHVRRTDDFGRMVFAMIECGLMSKTADDTIDDFRGVFDFAEAFAPDEIFGRLRR